MTLEKEDFSHFVRVRNSEEYSDWCPPMKLSFFSKYIDFPLHPLIGFPPTLLNSYFFIKILAVGLISVNLLGGESIRYKNKKRFCVIF